MSPLNYFVHTNVFVNGEGCSNEFLAPNISQFDGGFIGLETGKYYKQGLIVEAHRAWSVTELFFEIDNIKTIGLWRPIRKYIILKQYIDRIKQINDIIPNSVVGITEDYELFHIETIKELLVRTTPRKSKLQKIKLRENRILFSEELKNGYLGLAKICLNEKAYADFKYYVNEEFSKLSRSILSQQESYISIMDAIIETMRDLEIPFFIRHDWKARIIDLNYTVDQAITKNLGLGDVEIPLPEDYSERASISYDLVLINLRTALNEAGVEITCIDSESDQYIFLIHKAVDNSKVSTFINTIGLKSVPVEKY